MITSVKRIFWLSIVFVTFSAPFVYAQEGGIRRQVNELKDAVGALQTQLATVQSANSGLQNAITTLQVESATLQSANTSLQNEVAMLQAQEGVQGTTQASPVPVDATVTAFAICQRP